MKLRAEKPKSRTATVLNRSFQSSDHFHFTEFTKSERERAAEVLFDWRSRNGWRVSHSLGLSWRFFAFLCVPQMMIMTLLQGQSQTAAKRVLQFWLGLHTVVAVAFISYWLR